MLNFTKSSIDAFLIEEYFVFLHKISMFMKDIIDDIFNSQEITEENAPSVEESPETPDDWYRKVFAAGYKHVIAISVPDILPLRKSHIEIARLMASHFRFILSSFCPRVSEYQIVNTSIGFDKDRNYYLKDIKLVDTISDNILYEYPYHPGFVYKSEPYPGILPRCNNKNDVIIKFAIDFHGSIACFLYMCNAIQATHAYKCHPEQILIYNRKNPTEESEHPFSMRVMPEKAGGLTTNTIPTLTSTASMDREYIREFYQREHQVLKPSQVCGYQVRMLQNTFVINFLFAHSKQNTAAINRWFNRNIPEDLS